MSAPSPDRARIAALVRQARDILQALGLPKEQTNERSALTLLALLGVDPRSMATGKDTPTNEPWKRMQPGPLGITEIMDVMRDRFGKAYKPNTRETVRRQTIHQFVQAGLVRQNVDDLKRPTNSPHNRYEVAPRAIALIRTYATSAWEVNLETYLDEIPSLAQLYRSERDMQRIPMKLAPGMEIDLSPGGQSPLVRAVLDQFLPRFTPGATPLYVGDTARKWAYYDGEGLARLGVAIEAHGKMPDVVLHHTTENWLVLVEAVTSHGPMNAKRVVELRELFGGVSIGLVFVTAFPDKKTMVRYLPEIAWETEVWVADDPSHMIHFNGERFLGPYDPTP